MGRCIHGCYDTSACSLCSSRFNPHRLRLKQKSELYRYTKEIQELTKDTAVNHKMPWKEQIDVIEDILGKDCSLTSKASVDITKEIAELAGRRLYAVSIMWKHWYKQGQLGGKYKDIDRELVMEAGIRLGLSKTWDYETILK